jgi:hypothetical protein
MTVAEIGLNHLGSEEILDKYLRSACNVDALTIQVLSDTFFRLKNIRV